MITQKIRLDPNDLKYEDITKDFELLKFRQEASKKMKIRYNNPDDEDKTFIIESTDDIIFVRNKELNIEQKSSEYIRITFNMPKTLGTYTASVIVKNKKTGEIEEILRFHMQVVV